MLTIVNLKRTRCSKQEINRDVGLAVSRSMWSAARGRGLRRDGCSVRSEGPGLLSFHVGWLPGPGPVYTLTRICAVGYIKRVESVFEIIAEPNRRAILSLLISSQQSVGEIERQLRMAQPTVSKHLRVLREAGFVESTVDAQRRLYRLKPEPLQEIDAWLAPFRRFWSAHVDALERHLDRMDESTSAKRKTRRRPRGPNRGRDKGETK
jgi:DNA-binding transcriptional ArsR family regulator